MLGPTLCSQIFRHVLMSLSSHLSPTMPSMKVAQTTYYSILLAKYASCMELRAWSYFPSNGLSGMNFGSQIMVRRDPLLVWKDGTPRGWGQNPYLDIVEWSWPVLRPKLMWLFTMHTMCKDRMKELLPLPLSNKTNTLEWAIHAKCIIVYSF